MSTTLNDQIAALSQAVDALEHNLTDKEAALVKERARAKAAAMPPDLFSVVAPSASQAHPDFDPASLMRKIDRVIYRAEEILGEAA